MRTLAVAFVGLASFSGLALGCNALVGASEPGAGGNGPDGSIPGDGDAETSPLVDATVHEDGGADAPADATLDRTTPLTDGGDGGGGKDGAIDDGGADAIVLCNGACVPGNTRCDDGGVVTCAQTAAACPTWSAEVACPGGETCSTSGVSAFCCNDCCDSTSGCGASSCSGDAGGGGIDNCGPSFSESCCASTLVQGGTFYRDEDGVSYPDRTFPAQISSFALDRFEATVGRFRPFVDAWDQGWRPAPGSGKHTHVNGGRGLVDSSADAGTYETGWDPTWNTTIGASAADWNVNLACDSLHHTWTPDVGTAESRPIDCVSWYEAYAFCIWDGGFLPSEAEWNYAAAGGGGADGQRVYPWSSPATSAVIDCQHASYADCGASIYTVGKVSPTGDGKWGQSDLVGNVWEWTLDFQASFVNPCVDCAFLSDAGQGTTLRGADFGYAAEQLYVAYRLTVGTPAATRYADDGVRCARAP